MHSAHVTLKADLVQDPGVQKLLQLTKPESHSRTVLIDDDAIRPQPAAPFPYSSFPYDREVGLREAFYRTELRWIGEGQPAVHLVIDYPGSSR